ncbi:MAG: Rne/Rng family ribonuclease [Candidatus Hydrogenedentes bacterium]|nr:Rne/Rng family ribonuclease [Candidatus Hydrogenedentota bacterium]
MKEFIINIGPIETRIAVLEDKRLAELQFEREESRSIVGNVYKGRVDSIVPGIQAAFIDIGFEKNGFLYVSDIAGTEGTGDFVIEDGVAQAKSRGRRKTLSIESILKKNQYIMVQVSKDRLGTKGVRLTNFITFPGRYVVLMPTVTQLGVSRKIESEKERDRLKKLLQTLRPPGVGLITRTAGEGSKKADLQNDIKYLMKLWERVKTKMETVHGPGMLYEDLGPVLRIVRDTFTGETERLVVDHESEFARIQYFLDMYAPTLKKRCEFYKGPRPIFDQYEVEPEIEKALRRKVHLKSGGHICIDQTEALIAIDVNTGKFTGKTHLEETVFKTNIEAAEEIARQVRGAQGRPREDDRFGSDRTRHDRDDTQTRQAQPHQGLVATMPLLRRQRHGAVRYHDDRGCPAPSRKLLLQVEGEVHHPADSSGRGPASPNREQGTS